MNITADMAIEALRKLVTERGPDFVYVNEDGLSGEPTACQYVHGYGTPEAVPGCAVGAVLHGWGVTFDQLHTIEGQSLTTEGCVLDDELVKAGFKLTPSAIEVLASFQASQDCGFAYSTALEDAEDVDRTEQADA